MSSDSAEDAQRLKAELAALQTELARLRQQRLQVLEELHALERRVRALRESNPAGAA